MFARAKGEDYAHYRKRLTEIHKYIYGVKPTQRIINNRKQPLNKAELQEIQDKLNADLEKFNGLQGYRAHRQETLNKNKNYIGPTDIDAINRLNTQKFETLDENNGGWSMVVILAEKIRGEWIQTALPTRAQIKNSIEGSIGPIAGQDGVFSYVGINSNGMRSPPTTIFQNAVMDDKILDRIYGLCQSVSHDFTYNYTEIQISWVPTQFDWIEDFNVYHNPIQNCAIKLMCERYTSVKKNIEKIQLSENGGFGIHQMNQLAKIVRKNVVMKNAFDTQILKSDTSYKTDVVIYDVDAHAYNHIVEYPHNTTEVVLMDNINYNDIKNEYVKNDYFIYGCAEGFALTNGLHSFAIRNPKIFTDIENRAKELNVENYALLKTPFSVEFKKFKEINDIKNTQFAADLWRQSNLNTSPYSKPTNKKTYTADMNSAYESFKNCHLYEKYGFPHHESNRAFINPPIEVLDETGIVVVNVDIQRCHPWVQHRLNYQTRAVLPTVIAKFWGDKLAIKNIEMGIIAPKYMCELKRPDGAKYNTDGTRSWEHEHENTYKNSKHWFRQGIGRLIPNDSKNQNIYVQSHSEAINIIKEAKKNGTLKTYKYTRNNPPPNNMQPVNVTLSIEENYMRSNFNGNIEEYQNMLKNDDGYYTITLTNDEAAGAYHIHAYVLAYCHIQIDREIFEHDFNKVHKVLVDSITLTEQFSDNITNNIMPDTIGKWKYDVFKYYEYEKPTPNPVIIGDIVAGEYNKYLASSTPNLTILHAAPGHGKTHTCLNLIRNHKHIILTPTRKMSKKFKNEGFSALTRKFALNPYGSFDGVNMNLPKNALIYMPEIGFWELEEAKPCIEWLLRHNYTILADGDRFQMLPVNGSSAWDYFHKYHTVVDFVSEDYRSKDEETKQLKREIRGLTNSEIIQKIGTKKIEYLLENWHPNDYIYSTTHEIRQYLHKKLNEIYEEKYNGIPKRYIYNSKNKLSGEEVYELTQPEGTELAFCQTYNSCQGDTAELHRNVYLISDNTTEFFKNAIYVGATRVQKLSQLHIISLKQWV